MIYINDLIDRSIQNNRSIEKSVYLRDGQYYLISSNKINPKTVFSTGNLVRDLRDKKKSTGTIVNVVKDINQDIYEITVHYGGENYKNYLLLDALKHLIYTKE